MGFLLAQRVNLLQLIPGANADDLVQILYSMFGDDNSPNSLPGGVSTSAATSLPAPFTVQNSPPGVQQPVAAVQNQDGTTITLSLGDGGLQVTSTDPSGVATSLPVGDSLAKSTSSSAFPGNLTGYNGSNSYQVTIYPNGPSSGGISVNVLQLGGDPAFPHTVDGSVWTIVTKVGSSYVMALPVWQ
jgi:hypothetical protein